MAVNLVNIGKMKSAKSQLLSSGVISRLLYFTLALLTMILGLISRSSTVSLPEILTLYAGDTLWAALIYWMIRFFKPSSTPWVSAIMALAFAFAIEISQLYQAPWINEIRSTTLGALVFGFGFLVSDLVCYAVGVGVGFLLDNLARTSKLSKIISSN